MKKKLVLTPLQRILNGLSILTCISAVVYTIVVFPSLPDMIPSHFDYSGTVTSYSNKSMLIVLCFLLVFIITLPLSLLPRIRGLFDVTNTPFKIPKRQEEAVSELTRTLLCSMNLTLTALFTYIIYSTSKCRNMSSIGIWLPMALLFVMLIWYCIRCWQLSKQPKEWEPWDD